MMLLFISENVAIADVKNEQRTVQNHTPFLHD